MEENKILEEQKKERKTKEYGWLARTISMKKEMWEELDKRAKEREMHVSGLIRLLAKEYLSKQE